MSETFDLSWEDQDPEELAEAIAEIEEALTGKLGEAMVTAVLLIESTAKELVPVESGRLRSSIASKVKKIAEDEVKGFVGTNVEYAEAVEFGTDPHTITGDPLHWTEDGEDVFATSVDHPGTEPQPYLGPAIETHIDDIEDLLKDAVDDAVAEVS